MDFTNTTFKKNQVLLLVIIHVKNDQNNKKFKLKTISTRGDDAGLFSQAMEAEAGILSVYTVSVRPLRKTVPIQQ